MNERIRRGAGIALAVAAVWLGAALLPAPRAAFAGELPSAAMEAGAQDVADSVALLKQQLAQVEAQIQQVTRTLQQSTNAVRVAIGETEQGLAVLDELLTHYQKDEPLYRTRRSALLAILGRIDEARAELEAARAKPLCRNCAYGKCKDADIFESYIEEIIGNRSRAMELNLLGQKNWPDELDFHAGVTRLKKNKRGT